MVTAEVGTMVDATTEGALLLRVQSRMRRHVLRLSSCPSQPPRVMIITNGVEGRERLQPLVEDLHVIEPLVQSL
jgi:hypothetical protein